MKALISILISLIPVLCMVLGHYIAKKYCNKSNAKEFLISYTFISLFVIDIVYILPKIITAFNTKYITTQSYALLLLIVLAVYFLLNVFDKNLKNKLFNTNLSKELVIVTYIFNLLEGINIYYIGLNKSLIIFIIILSLLNFILGILLSINKVNLKKALPALIIAPFIGVLLSFVFSIKVSKSLTIGVFYSIVFGSIIYINVKYMWPLFKKRRISIYKVFGILGGALLLLLAMFTL